MLNKLYSRATLAFIILLASLACLVPALHINQSEFPWLVILFAFLAAACGLVLWLNLCKSNKTLESVADAIRRRFPEEVQRRLVSDDFAAYTKKIEEHLGNLLSEHNVVKSERDQLLAVYGAMREGLIAVDGRMRLMEVNQAAFDLLGCKRVEFSRASGEAPELARVLRHAGLQRFAQKVISSPESLEEVLTVDDEDGERYLQAYGLALRKNSGEKLGTLIVFYDITRLHLLEKVRREFIANVSHELKTPVTSIKGFVETLADGAIDNREDARRFLAIISRQADRLNAIFEDLLNLSRIELEKERGEIKLEWGALEDVVSSVVQTWERSAAERRISLFVDCPPDIRLRMNSSLLEQALGNLVENALKYSDSGSQVRIVAQRIDGEVRISVKDSGRGIENVHLNRIFERFYRVDRARSRKEGGTGLGLAIVKHIAQAHGGYPSVESAVGAGSCFCIHIPCNGEAALDVISGSNAAAPAQNVIERTDAQ